MRGFGFHPAVGGTIVSGMGVRFLLVRSLARLLLCCAVVSVPAAAAAQPAPPVPGPEYLVAPFENSGGEGRVNWLTEASAIILTDDLRTLGIPAVSYEDRMRALERLHIPAVASLSLATTIRLGQVVGATHAVVGSFELEGEQLTVRARTIELEAGRLSAEIVESGPIDELFTIYARIMRRIVPDPGMTLEEMEREHPRPAAFEQYVRGLLAQEPATRVSYLTHARRLDPAFQRSRLALWDVYTEQGEHEEALALVRDVPEDHRVYRRAQFLAAVSQINLERYDEAFEIFTALNVDAADPALYNNLGIVQLRRGRDASGGPAVSYFGDALRLDASDADIMFNLGYAYVLAEEYAQGIPWLREALRRRPADSDAHYVLGAALQASGRAAEGAREKDLAARLSEDLAEFAATGQSGVPAGLERPKTDIDVPASLRLEHALADAEQRGQQQTVAFQVASARRLFDAKNDSEAIAALGRVVFLDPYHSEAHLLLGRLYLRAGRVEDAIDSLKISIWSAETVEAHLALAEAYITADDREAAREQLQRVLKRDPENREAQRLLGEL